MRQPIPQLAALLHNDIQDLFYALEYDEHGKSVHVPERLRHPLATLYTRSQLLTLTVKDESCD
jgi:hypothetical protein